MKTQKRKYKKNRHVRKTKKGGVGSSSSYKRNLKAATQAAKKEYERAKWCGDRNIEGLKEEYKKIKFKPFNKTKIKTLDGCIKDLLKQKYKKEDQERAQKMFESWQNKIKEEKAGQYEKKSRSVQKGVEPRSSYSKLPKGSFEKVTPIIKREANLKEKLNKSMKLIENPPTRLSNDYGKEFDYSHGIKPNKRTKSSGYNKLNRSLADPKPQPDPQKSQLNVSTESSIDLDLDLFEHAN